MDTLAAARPSAPAVAVRLRSARRLRPARFCRGISAVPGGPGSLRPFGRPHAIPSPFSTLSICHPTADRFLLHSFRLLALPSLFPLFHPLVLLLFSYRWVDLNSHPFPSMLRENMLFLHRPLQFIKHIP